MNTAEWIDHCVEKDQGALFRKHLKDRIFQLTDAFSEEKREGPRGHLGASVIGDPCARRLWFSFRCASDNIHCGRIHRLFNRGHLEEARFEALLLAADCELWTHDETGKQFRFSDLGGHFGGSIDSVVRGIPEMPDVPVLAEYKTHSEKSFSSVKTKGVLSAHEKHFVQMQVYMHYMQLTHSLYLAVNKNTDELYSEVVPYAREVALQYIDRAEKIIFAPRMPPRISDNAGWWQCKFCGLYDKCFGKKPYDVRFSNCRNCAMSSPLREGSHWGCNKGFADVVLEDFTPCSTWLLHQDIEDMAK